MKASLDENSRSLCTPEKSNSKQSQATQGDVTSEKLNNLQKNLKSFEKEDSNVRQESVCEENCTESLSVNNKFWIGKPTEYSASVDQQLTTQRDEDHEA